MRNRFILGLLKNSRSCERKRSIAERLFKDEAYRLYTGSGITKENW
ncbi:MAG: hypothetical protein LBL39_01805 [Planctomycetaceae bacterium]|nr:hypothetical protein [Planctomycetaceae bacterium]